MMRHVYRNGMRWLGMATLWLAFVSACNVAAARQKPHFNYQKLFKEADVVVIATPVKTDDTDDKFLGHENNFRGQNTEFKIQKVVQGNIAGEKLQLLHFKYVGAPTKNGPMLVKFEARLETEAMIAQVEYLLFLKRTDDGRYVPVSDQYDSEDSVKILAPPGIN